MKPDLLIGTFATQHDLLDATRAARHRGFPILDAYTPYPVHGLDEAMGLRPSRLGGFCFVCGVVGVVSALALQHWTMAIDWPINVGGRPFNSWPAFVPVAFELLVLCAGFGVVFAFLGVSRLYPGKRAAIAGARVSNDQFVLVIEASGEATNAEAVFALFRTHGAVAVDTCENGMTNPQTAFPMRALNAALLVLLGAGAILNWTLSSDHGRPNMEFMPEMTRAISHESYGDHPGLPKSMVLQSPPDGTIARGQLPLHYQATPKDAERAGEELTNPFKLGDNRWQPRGAVVYANYCALCHGAGGAGDGPVSQRGVPPPPSLRADKARSMKDGQLFHIITYGQTNMASYAAQISPEDRWAVILHVRQLQDAKGAGP
jgi:mono/diheme cytochrome c family protein